MLDLPVVILTLCSHLMIGAYPSIRNVFIDTIKHYIDRLDHQLSRHRLYRHTRRRKYKQKLSSNAASPATDTPTIENTKW